MLILTLLGLLGVALTVEVALMAAAAMGACEPSAIDH